jgi:hypothetical protein
MQVDMKIRKLNGGIGKNDSSKNADVMDDFFSKVFNNHWPIDVTVLDKLKQGETIAALGDPPRDKEFAAAMRRIANGKSPGEVESHLRL